MEYKLTTKTPLKATDESHEELRRATSSLFLLLLPHNYVVDLQKSDDTVGGRVGFSYNGGKSTTDSLILIKFNYKGNTCKDSAFITSSYNWNFTLPAFTYDTTDISSYIKIKDTALFIRNVFAHGVRDAYSPQLYSDDVITSMSADNTIKPNAFSLSIYPNPVTGTNLTVLINKVSGGSTYLTIADVQGKTV